MHLIIQDSTDHETKTTTMARHTEFKKRGKDETNRGKDEFNTDKEIRLQLLNN